MTQPMFHFDDAVFTYAIAPRPLERFSRHTPVLDGTLTVSHTSKTEVRSARRGEREAVVIGLCVDAHGEAGRDDIPDLILAQPWRDTLSVYRFCDRFAGRFVIMYQNGSELYLFADATASLQINYGCKDGSVCAAATAKLAADALGASFSERGVKIRRGSTLSQPMPNDLTEYEGVRCLLPNHFLDWSRQRAIRVPLNVQPTSSKAEINAILTRTAVLAETISQAYGALYSYVLPLTAGADSRTVLSFLKKKFPGLVCFTYKHHFTPQAPEIAMPKKLCELCGLPYLIIEEQKTPDSFLQAVQEVMGEYCDPVSVNLAYNFRTRFSNQAAVNGAVIGEVGKISHANTVPLRLLNTAFSMCKIHNYEPLAKDELDAYREEILSAGEGRHIADLFAMEIKLGRRVGMGLTVLSICGATYLNIFNCREMILQWARLPRRVRLKKTINKEFMRRNDPRLLEFPINPGSRVTSALKNFWPAFYLATFVKYGFQRLRRP